jgi:1-acyl-sn-glycerol-3-phosphate acyltransferase
MLLYWFAWVLLQVILPVLRRWKVIGRTNLPSEGGVIVIANHQSYWDPLVLGAALPRRVFFMAKEELFRIPVFGAILRLVGAFPVKRESFDRKAFKTALDYLMRGRVVGIFPEGRRSHTGQFLPPQPGAVFLALKAGAPLVPVGLIGTRGVFGKVTVQVGKPFFLHTKSAKPSRAEIEDGSAKITAAIAALAGADTGQSWK